MAGALLPHFHTPRFCQWSSNVPARLYLLPSPTFFKVCYVYIVNRFYLLTRSRFSLKRHRFKPVSANCVFTLYRIILVTFVTLIPVAVSGVEMPGNGFLHSNSLPFPCNRFPFLPIPISNFVINSHSHEIPIRLFPFLPIPIPEHYIDAA